MNYDLPRIALYGIALFLLAACPLLMSSAADAQQPESTRFDTLVNQPADIAHSAYQYRADRKPEENSPESWFALLHFAKLPLNAPVDVGAPAIKQALCGLLWEEIRPVQTLELTWPADSQRQPEPSDLTVTILERRGTANSWWNNVIAAQHSGKPKVSADRRTYSYNLSVEACGLVVAIGNGKPAADYDVPQMRVLTPETWKAIDVEVEWGFDEAKTDADYSGRIEAYDGGIADLQPLAGDAVTKTFDDDRWSSSSRNTKRRGVRFRLLYIGTSKWRKIQPFTSQAEDVARTIVTLWTKGGNFSFLAGDLENGPILAPEYGFFVRCTSPAAHRSPTAPIGALQTPRTSLALEMRTIAGSDALRGWSGKGGLPWFGGNPTPQPVDAQGIVFPPRAVSMHPAANRDVAVTWRSPSDTSVTIAGKLTSAHAGSNGVTWSLWRDSDSRREVWSQGVTNGTDPAVIAAGTDADAIAVKRGDLLSLALGANGNNRCDTNVVELMIHEVGGEHRVWSLPKDVIDSLDKSAPANSATWSFDSLRPVAVLFGQPSQPPLNLASEATTARDFVRALAARQLHTIREQTRAHSEQTWEGAVRVLLGGEIPPYIARMMKERTDTVFATFPGGDLPSYPVAPKEFEPVMKVRVPSERLTAQWNLGPWHLLRHAERHPSNGRLWFNDYPYGILAAENHLILQVIDQIGLHKAADDGLDQWLSLPLDVGRPTGLFSEGQGSLTNAKGPPGVGNDMDGLHAMGPGAIGCALVEHYRLSGDTEWFKAAAPRMKANAEWMMRQRRLMSSIVPGGDRLWCKGLQPALQVTPDAGGMWMNFYESEAYYWGFISRFSQALSAIDPQAAAALAAEAAAYRKDLYAAVERSIALSPVVPVRDGTYHSVIPFACYVRGLGTGAWGWRRDCSDEHVGPLYWETVQTAASLISTAGLLPADDVRVQGYLDVLEDRLLLENFYVAQRCPDNWFAAGWQYQSGLERTANMHLAADDIPVFLRSFLNGYAVEILPAEGYTFNEHTVHGPPDKVFEEAAFLERFRNLLVMEDADRLWLARAVPRAWLAQGERITVTNAPTYFGTVSYEIVSDVDHGQISASVDLPSREPAAEVWLRLRHPDKAPIKAVTINGNDSKGFDRTQELIKLPSTGGKVMLTVHYGNP